MAQLLLASTSPRRRQLLQAAGIPFALHPPGPEPAGESSATPAELALFRARAKASAATQPPESLVLGVDTVVDLQGCELGKPADRAAAEAMLRRLSGRTHLVHTGHCLIDTRGGEPCLALASAEVRFDPLDPATLGAFLDSGTWQGKAGAYGIQDEGCGFAHLVQGDLDTVIGLHVAQVVAWLEEADGA